MRPIFFCLLMVCFVFARGQETDTTWFKKGNNAFYKVKLAKAIDCYSKAIELNPKYTNAYYNRGLVKTQLDKHTEAIEDYTQVIALDSNSFNAYYKRASSYFSLRKFKEAIKDYDKVIALQPGNAQAYFDRATAKLFIDDYKGYAIDQRNGKEIKELPKKKQQKQDTTWLYKADLAAKIGRYTDAIDYYTQSILVNDYDANTYFKRGIAYLNLYLYTDAIKDFQVAALLNPNVELYKINLKLAITQDSIHRQSNQAYSVEREHVSQAVPDNRYSPFHETIKDISHKTVSDVGCYFSAGIGLGNIRLNNLYNAIGTGGGAAVLSASIAYKSHLFTVTRAGAGTILKDVGPGGFVYTSNYVGFLVGESVRYKHAMLSVSVGIAHATINVTENVNSYMVAYKQYNGIAFPIECKAFLYAHNGIGIGLHLSKSIGTAEFSPFYFGICMVVGYWNTSRIQNLYGM